jgi:hypothetical protein
MKKKKKKTYHPFTISTVPHPLQQSQRKEKNLYSPAIRPKKALK